MIRNAIQVYRSAYSGLPSQIWMLSIALFVNRLGTMVLPFLTLYLTRAERYSDSTAGWMVSVYGLGAVIGAYAGGRLTKPIGAVRLQIILLFLSVPLFLILPFCETILQLASTILILSIVSEGVRPANATAITEFSKPEQRTRSFALQRMALNLGYSFGPAIGGLLISFDFFWIFVADAITTLAGGVLLILFFGFCKPGSDPSPTDEAKSDAGSRSPSRDIDFLLFLVLTFAGALVFFQYFTTYPLYLSVHYGLSEFQIGQLYAVNTVLIVIFEMVFVSSVRKWNLLVIIGWGSFLTCLGFGILPFSSAVWFCVFSVIVLTAGEMLSAPLSSGWVSERSENGDTGAYMGWYTMSYSLAFIIGPAAGGMIYQQDKATVFYLSILVGVFVLAGFYWLNHRISAA